MTSQIKISKKTARQFLIRKMGLSEIARPVGFSQAVEMLECIQLDPVSIIERNHHLVLMARLPFYKPSDLEASLQNHETFEYFANAACLIPMKDYPLFKTIRKKWKENWQKERQQFEPTVHAIFNQLYNHGRLPSKAFQSDTKVVGGWDHPDKASTKETTHVLGMLLRTGDIQVTGRQGAERYFSLTKDAIPEASLYESEHISDEEAEYRLLQKYLRAYRFVEGAADPRFGWQSMKAAQRKQMVQTLIRNGSLVAAEIDGVEKTYAVLKEDVEKILAIEKDNSPLSHSRTVFLPPLDNLLWHRGRIEDLFHFIYRWEIYTPAAKRKYGPYSMPVLRGESIIARADPVFDRRNGTLTWSIHYAHKESESGRRSVCEEAESFGRRIGAKTVHINEH